MLLSWILRLPAAVAATVPALPLAPNQCGNVPGGLAGWSRSAVEASADTRQIADDYWLQEYFIDRIEQMYWGLGLEDGGLQDTNHAWLKPHQLLVGPI